MHYKHLLSAACLTYAPGEQVAIPAKNLAARAAFANSASVPATNFALAQDKYGTILEEGKVPAVKEEHDKKHRKACMLFCCCFGVTAAAAGLTVGLLYAFKVLGGGKSDDVIDTGSDIAYAAPFFTAASTGAVQLLAMVRADSTLAPTTTALTYDQTNALEAGPFRSFISFFQEAYGMMVCYAVLAGRKCFYQEVSDVYQVCAVKNDMCNGMRVQSIDNGLWTMKGFWNHQKIREPYTCTALLSGSGPAPTTVYGSLYCLPAQKIMFLEQLYVMGANAFSRPYSSSGAGDLYMYTTINMGNSIYLTIYAVPGIGCFLQTKSNAVGKNLGSIMFFANPSSLPIDVTQLIMDVARAQGDTPTGHINTDVILTNQLRGNPYLTKFVASFGSARGTETATLRVTKTETLRLSASHTLEHSDSYRKSSSYSISDVWTFVTTYEAPGTLGPVYTADISEDTHGNFRDENGRAMLELTNNFGTIYVYTNTQGDWLTQDGGRVYDLPVDSVNMFVFQSGNTYIEQEFGGSVTPIMSNNEIIGFAR